MPSPIDTSQVAIILAYIHAQHHIPPALLSTDLIKRHHFLNIDPDNLHQYLCWPTQDAAHPDAVDRLQSLPLDEVHNPVYSAQYTADPEHEYAHCYLRSTGDTSDPGLRLVFQWDTSENVWKYHNLALMPFPPGSHPDLAMSPSDHLLHPASADDFLQEPTMVMEDDGGDDAYWNACGEDDEQESDPAASKSDVPVDPEEAYWAQYAAVHGSGDSTQPSPLPTKRNKSSHLPNDPEIPQNQPRSRAEPTVFSYTAIHPVTKPNNDFPSPHTLADKLNAISPRATASPYDQDSPDTPEEHVDYSGAMSGTDSTTPSPPPGLVKLGVKSAGSLERRVPIDLSVVTSPPTFSGPPSEQPKQSQVVPQSDNEETDALKESIGGLYRLWKAGRRRTGQSPPVGAPASDEKELFLNIVSQAIQISH
ncbi:hypothetical protein HGRIS_007884 [Hohenbuehelia grisea]|uniref:Uncharacterized protein n=1 Tax=Hohenbuehelia grisea TaxID=104357 RepID=A0ABR3J6Q0_9AGAR